MTSKNSDRPQMHVLLERLQQQLAAVEAKDPNLAREWQAQISAELAHLGRLLQEGTLLGRDARASRRELNHALGRLEGWLVQLEEWERQRLIEEKNATTIPPDILEWARQQFNEVETLADLREIEETGGYELRDFIHELERAAGTDE